LAEAESGYRSQEAGQQPPPDGRLSVAAACGLASVGCVDANIDSHGGAQGGQSVIGHAEGERIEAGEPVRRPVEQFTGGSQQHRTL